MTGPQSDTFARDGPVVAALVVVVSALVVVAAVTVAVAGVAAVAVDTATADVSTWGASWWVKRQVSRSASRVEAMLSVPITEGVRSPLANAVLS
jgi:hypothetical protein